ncbi:MAG TPA: NAD-dependent epimerase/dehydratase family protein [Candidatus Limnocylindria bacterium]|nr:NAD-dependent epimerase/dehydratase family protein [Candidatus Limnocylindria bacterium]
MADPETVLVTGGSGFIGAYTAAELTHRGHGVVSYDVAPASWGAAAVLEALPDRPIFVRGDVADLSELIAALREHGVTRIFHAAAVFDPPVSMRHPAPCYRVNVMGTVNVLEAARAVGIERVVMASSIAVYAPRRYEPIDEAHPIATPADGNPLGPYGASKAAAELIGLTYAGTGLVDFVGLRYSGVYGFGMRYPMYVRPMVEDAVDGTPVRFETGGDMPRDYTYVVDVARATASALFAPRGSLAQRVFNIATGRLTTASQLADTVRDVLPEAEIEIGPGLTEYERSDARMRGRLTIDAAREQLGWQPEFDLGAGIRDYADRYRAFRAQEA